MIRFLIIDETLANYLATKIDEEYTPGYNTDPKYYFYKDSYTISELPYTEELTETVADGLTPINPQKPMFPKK